MLAVGLDCLQMISELDTGQCASEEAETRRGCTRCGVPPKGVDWEVSHRLEKRTSVNKDAGHQRGVDCEIPYR